MASSANQYSSEKTKKEVKSPGSQNSRETEPGLDKKYTQEEIDAANALLSLKYSAAAPAPPAAGYTFTVIDHRTNPVPPGHSAAAAQDIKTPFPPQTPAFRPAFHYQPPVLNHVSPLAELENFVTTRFPGMMEDTSRPSYQDFAAARQFPWMQCAAHGVWTCRRCFSHTINH